MFESATNISTDVFTDVFVERSSCPKSDTAVASTIDLCFESSAKILNSRYFRRVEFLIFDLHAAVGATLSFTHQDSFQKCSM